MNTSLEKTKELIKYFKQKNPAYEEILNFYENVLEEQLNTEFSISIIPQKISGHADKLQIKEGFPLIDKKDFILNIPSSIKLFESICKIGKSATEKMRENIQAIEDAITINALNLKELLRRFYDESYINKIATEFDIDKTILTFLIYKSIQPSIHANVEKVKDQVDLKD